MAFEENFLYTLARKLNFPYIFTVKGFELLLEDNLENRNKAIGPTYFLTKYGLLYLFGILGIWAIRPWQDLQENY